jgi:hypothetical protein
MEKMEMEGTVDLFSLEATALFAAKKAILESMEAIMATWWKSVSYAILIF